MTVPLTFEDLSEHEQLWMLNGCGPGFWSRFVPEMVWHDACQRHDFDYWLGFTKHDRYRADRRFLTAMLKAASDRARGWWSRRWYRMWAWRYYYAVRLLAKGSFSYRDRYGSREDLEREMAE